jgi:hypothetical protein
MLDPRRKHVIRIASNAGVRISVLSQLRELNRLTQQNRHWGKVIPDVEVIVHATQSSYRYKGISRLINMLREQILVVKEVAV